MIFDLKKLLKPVDSRIEKQKQTIKDQEKILDYMRKDLHRLEGLRDWTMEKMKNDRIRNDND